MLTEDISSGIEDISWLFLDSFFEKFLHRHLPDKTESLRVLSESIWESSCMCNLSYLGLQEVPDRK